MGPRYGVEVITSKYYVICGRLLTPHSFSAILGKSIAQSNANEKGPIVRKMQIDSICSTVSSPISSLPSQENSGRGSALRCLMDIYVLIGLAHGCVLVGFPSIGTGQGNFSGQRDRSFFIVLGQRDNGTSSKSCHGTGRARTNCQNSGRDAGRDNHYFSVKIRDGTWDGTGQSLFFS